MCREHVSLENLTRLYGIDPSARPGRCKSSNSQSALENRNLSCESFGSGNKP